jgi:Mn2+/Fe2+ NRAMP family transporter
MLLRVWRRRLAYSRILVLLSVVGPGIITATADNDATGILGYAQAGAQYRFALVWVLVLSAIALAVAQEMCARMGAVTGKGLADLIREEYGVKVTLVAMVALLVANFATTIAEFAGILAAVSIFAGPGSRFIVLPLIAGAIWLLITRGTYRKVERFLLGLSLVYLCYIVSAILAHPPWGEVLRQVAVPDLSHVTPLKPYVFMVINVIGTTITPWGQFYVQSAIRDKGVGVDQVRYARIDVLVGSAFTGIIGCFIIVCCGATLFPAGIHQITDAGQAAAALAPISGSLASVLFALGLFNASLFGAIVLPLSSAYAVTEALGWESGVGRRVKEAPLFIAIYTFLIVASAVVVMLFPRHLTTLIILPNIVGGMLLPIILILMQRLVSNRRIMGQYTNSPLYNVVCWSTTAILTALSVVLIITQLL